MSTPGRRRALKKLAARKRGNARRLAAGKKPILNGKPVAPSTFRRRTGQSTSRKVNREKVRRQPR